MGIKERVKKLRMAYLATKEVHNKKSISMNKIRHHKVMMKNIVLYVAETITL